jgi:hypothetical protein
MIYASAQMQNQWYTTSFLWERRRVPLLHACYGAGGQGEIKINANEGTGNTENVSALVRYWVGESAQYCGKQKKASFQPAEQKWQAPRGDVLKINCDGAFFTETKTGG